MLDQERAKQLSAQMNLGIAEALVLQFAGQAKARLVIRGLKEND